VGAGAHPSPLDGQRPDGAPPFGPHRVAAVGSSSGAPAGGMTTGPGSSRSVDALSLEEEERQRRDLQRAFGVTPEEVAWAQWKRSTRDKLSLDPPSAAGGSGPSLHGVGGGATHGLSRPVADTARLLQVAEVSGATRGPGLRPWHVGYRSPHGSARGSGLCTSCVSFLRVYESMLWGHRACSNKSSLRLRCFRRFCALRARWSRRSRCDSGVAIRILCWVF